MNRRSFLQSILAAGVAPAFIGSGVLMPSRKILTPGEFYDGMQWSDDELAVLPRGASPLVFNQIQSTLAARQAFGLALVREANKMPQAVFFRAMGAIK